MSAETGSSQTWLFQTWLFAIFMRKRSFVLFCALLHPFALFCALLRSFALFSGIAFALFRAHLRGLTCFCVRPRLERPRLGTADKKHALNVPVSFVDFRWYVSWETETTQIFHQYSALFLMPIPPQLSAVNFEKVLWRALQATKEFQKQSQSKKWALNVL